MVETFGKSWVLLFCQFDLVTVLTDGVVAHSFKREGLSGTVASTLIICLIAVNYFYH